MKEYKFNIELAKSLLGKAEISTDSPQLELSTFPENYSLAQKISESWKAIGVNALIKVVLAFPPDYDVILGTQEIPADPDQYALWHSTQETTNITHYNNPKIDKLLEEGRKEKDKDQRQQIYREFQRYIIDDAPVRFLIHPSVYTIRRK